jgi:hypothetical protein
MARIAIGDGDEFDVVAHGHELGRGAGSANVAIIGVRAESDDAKLAIGVLRGEHGGAHEEKHAEFYHEGELYQRGLAVEMFVRVMVYFTDVRAAQQDRDKPHDQERQGQGRPGQHRQFKRHIVLHVEDRQRQHHHRLEYT